MYSADFVLSPKYKDHQWGHHCFEVVFRKLGKEAFLRLYNSHVTATAVQMFDGLVSYKILIWGKR